MTQGVENEFCAILDFGSQYSQLIARRVRENRVYSEILPHDTTAAALRGRPLKGIILSGGPCGVYEEGAPTIDPALFELGVPVLGICYGMQIACQALGGTIVPAEEREYGDTALLIDDTKDPLLGGLPEIDICLYNVGAGVRESAVHLAASSRMLDVTAEKAAFCGANAEKPALRSPEKWRPPALSELSVRG